MSDRLQWPRFQAFCLNFFLTLYDAKTTLIKTASNLSSFMCCTVVRFSVIRNEEKILQEKVRAF